MKWYSVSYGFEGRLVLDVVIDGGAEVSLEKIRRILKRHEKELKEKFKVKEIGVFGSYVRGEQRERSDVDILVDFYGTPTFFEFVELENYLSEVLGVKVDLVMKRALKPKIREGVLKEVAYIWREL